MGILFNKEGEKSIHNKVYSILVVALDSNQYVFVNKTSMLAQA
jgi:hypothetical protein